MSTAPLVLGIHVGHDACASLVSSSGVISTIREEQLSGIKHHNGFPRRSIEHIRNLYLPADIRLDAIAFTSLGPFFGLPTEHVAVDIDGTTIAREEGSSEIASFLVARNARLLTTYHGFEDRLHFSDENFATFNSLVTAYDRVSVYCVHHHLAHAACFRFGVSNPTRVCTLDGRGDAVSGAVFSVERGRLELIYIRPVQASLGAFYQCATELTGFLGVDSEYKVMGLAPFGIINKQWYTLIRNFLHSNQDWSWEPYRTLYPLRSKNNPIFGVVPPEPIHECFNSLSKQDFAATVQAVFEDAVVEYLKLYSHPGDRVFVSGGVFLNARCNQVIKERLCDRAFEFFFDSGDGGLAAGAASEVMYRRYGSKRLRYSHDCGVALDEKELDRLIQANNLTSRFVDVEELADIVLKGEIIGFCEGRSEVGPRALGNRSILASAFRPDLIDEINRRKRREAFIPVAPSMLLQTAQKVLSVDGSEEFMVVTVPSLPALKKNCAWNRSRRWYLPSADH